MRKYSVVVILLALFTVTTAQASCFNPNTDTRLRTFCVAERLVGTAVSFNDAVLLDKLLKQEGYERGIGLPGVVPQTAFSPYAMPIIDYSTDVNGGNPNRPLVLGNFTFTGDETLLRKEGLVAGVGVGADGRHIYGERRYLDYGLGISYAHSSQHDIGIGRAFANVHSRNHVRNHWYVDAYASTNTLWRDLSDDKTSAVGVNLVKLFATEQRRYHQATVGVRRLYDDDYEQNQISGGLQTIHSNRLYTAINATVGADVKNTLAANHSISATVGTVLFNNPLSATYTYSYADGGKLLGIDRQDTSQSFTVTYSAHPRVSVTLGYRETDSSISYFSESEPMIGIQFIPIRF